MGKPEKEGISQAQRRLMRGAINKLGLDEYYYDILQAQAGVTSSRDLTQAGFRAVMDYLEKQGFEHTKGYMVYRVKWSRLGHRPGMASPKELAMIEYLWDRIEFFWNPPGPAEGGLAARRSAALRGFLEKRFKVNDLRFLGPQQAYGCIEALKAIRDRHEQQAVNGEP